MAGFVMAFFVWAQKKPLLSEYRLNGFYELLGIIFL